jgi:hypothetical protein
LRFTNDRSKIPRAVGGDSERGLATAEVEGMREKVATRDKEEGK